MIRRRVPDQGWVMGQIGPYPYEVRIHNESSRFGISADCVSPLLEREEYGGGGRVSKLLIRNQDGRWLINYDRGWDLLPTTEEATELVRQVLHEVEADEGMWWHG